MTALLLVVLGAAAAAAVYLPARKRRAKVTERLLRYTTAAAAGMPAVRRARRSLRQAFLDTVSTRLSSGGIPLRPNEYLLLLAASVASCALAGLMMRGPLGGLLTGGAAALLVWSWPARAAERRRAVFVQQLPGAISAMAGAMRAGQGLLHALRIVADEYPDPVGNEFRAVHEAAALGLPPSEAIRRMRRRTGIEELSYLETAVALNQQTGADLGFLLDRISNSLRARLEAEAELRALTTQTRFGGRVLTWVPVGLMAAMYLMDRDYGPTMLGTLAGNLVLALSGALLMAGRMWFKRITEGI